jgi:transposase
MNDILHDPSVAAVGPVESEGGRSPSTHSTAAVVPAGGLAPGQRWSVGCKREVVLRLLRGESAESLSRHWACRCTDWRAGASARYRDRRIVAGTRGRWGERELAAAMKRIGELTMENEVLRARVGHVGPLARRRSR